VGRAVNVLRAGRRPLVVAAPIGTTTAISIATTSGLAVPTRQSNVSGATAAESFSPR
jgi:hypothetical protein